MDRKQTIAGERWSRVQRILGSALELPPEKRLAYLKEACAGDETLIQEIGSFLEFDNSGDSFLEYNANRYLSLTDGPETPGIEGRRIGSYEVGCEIGHGGMGIVYLATRADDQYRKQVAIKLVRAGLATGSVLGRFLTERQILANLDHPNIAGLFDGGATEDGVPYLVMEYVKGAPITDYCDRERLGIEQRLKMFLDVCTAVQYAHRNLVVHRDIKPGNILVTEDGIPKLLDFGIAKLLSPDAADQNVEPGTATRLMTPEYASPEQIRGERISTATDTYSLAVLLYQLLTGLLPYRLKNRSPHEVIRAVLEQAPERPSTAGSRRTGDALATHGPTAGGTAGDSTRGGLPESNRRRLRGDIDNILLKALRKEPGRRYESVSEFAEDIRRHLAGRPVLARRGTFTYRTGRFLGRNKLAVSASALLLLTLLAGIVASILEAQRANRRFNQVRKLAHAVLFDYHDAIADLPGATPIRQRMVSDALEYLDSLMQERPDPSLKREIAAAYDKIGEIQGNAYFSNLGDTSAALKSCGKALAILENLSAANPTDAALQDQLAQAYRGLGDIQYTEGNLPEGLKTYERALSIEKALTDAEPNNSTYRQFLATIYTRLGDIKGLEGYSNLGDLPGSIESYGRAETLLEALSVSRPEDPELRLMRGRNLSCLTMLLDTTGDVPNALERGRGAIDILEHLAASDPNNSRYRMELLSSYAFLRYPLADDGETQEAIENSRKVIGMLANLSAVDPQNAFATRSLGVAYNALGRDLLAAGDISGALASHRKALQISGSILATDPSARESSADFAFTLERLAEAESAARDFKQALADYRKALDIRESLLAADPSNARTKGEISTIYAGIGTALAATGDKENAIAVSAHAVQEAESVSSKSPANVRLRSDLALRYQETGLLCVNAIGPRGKSPFRIASRLTASRLQAKGLFEKSWLIWTDLLKNKKLYRIYSGKPEELRHELAECDSSPPGSR